MTINPSESGVDATAIEAALAEPAFAQVSAAGGPIIVAAGHPSRIVWSNPAAQTYFAATGLDLERRIFGGAEPGSKRLAELARLLVPGAAPRLERLRFFIARRAETLTFVCRRTAGPNSLFVLALPGVTVPVRAVPQPVVAAPQPMQAAPEQIVAEHAPEIETPEVAAPLPAVEDPIVTPVADVAVPPAEEPAPEPVVDVVIAAPARVAEPVSATLRDLLDVAAGLAARVGTASTVRFLWQTDAQHRFVKITGELCQLVGCIDADMIGQSFVDLAARLDLDPDHRLRDAFARGETWSGLEVLWPVAGSSAALPIVLGALPAHDRDRHFEGFRGFGVIHVTRIQDRPQADVTQRVSDTDSDALDSALEASAPVAERDTPAVPEIPAALVEDTPVADVIPGVEAPTAKEPEPVAASPAPPVEVVTADKSAAPVQDSGNVVTLRPFQVVPRRPAEPEAPVVPAVESTPFVPPANPEPPVLAPKPPRASEPLQANESPREDTRAADMVSLSPSERLAFREIARALGARVRADLPGAPDDASDSPSRDRMRDLIEVANRVAGEDATAAADIPAAESAPTPPLADVPAPQGDRVERDNAPAVLDRLPLGILVSRGDDTLYVNRTLLDIVGYSDMQDFVEEKALSQMFRGRQGEAFAETSDGGAIPVVTRNGDVVALDARVQSMDWAGAPASLITFRRSQEQDLSYRVRSLETELRASEAETRELHAILDTATDGVAVLDEDGHILALNRAGEALFGFDQNEVAGESFTILFAKESQAGALDYLAGLRQSGVASVLNDGRDVIGRARQGGSIPLFMTLGRVGAAGKPKFCAVLRDMTHWKKAERELREARLEAEHASALKSDFLAKISHEIRTPLNAILGFAEVIMEERFGPVGNERYKDYLKDIHASGSHVMSLVNDLLDLSKIEAGKLELNFGSVDANRVVSECVSLIQPQAARERVIVRLSLAPRLPNIVADERALRQIVLNLLSNAVKFNEPGGQVIVSSALTDAGHAVIRIRDTGIGMSESEIETALEPFRQVATARHTTGTGLGLPLTKALVEANRASFSIKSKKAEGTLVEVAFPPTRVLAE